MVAISLNQPRSRSCAFTVSSVRQRGRRVSLKSIGGKGAELRALFESLYTELIG